MSPTAYRRSVSVGCCSSPRCRLHDTTWTESSSTPITQPSFEPSTAYQPGKRLTRVHQAGSRSEEHTSELQSHVNLVCRLLLEKKKKNKINLLVEKKKKKKN